MRDEQNRVPAQGREDVWGTVALVELRLQVVDSGAEGGKSGRVQGHRVFLAGTGIVCHVSRHLGT